MITQMWHRIYVFINAVYPYFYTVCIQLYFSSKQRNNIYIFF